MRSQTKQRKSDEGGWTTERMGQERGQEQEDGGAQEKAVPVAQASPCFYLCVRGVGFPLRATNLSE